MSKRKTVNATSVLAPPYGASLLQYRPTLCAALRCYGCPQIRHRTIGTRASKSTDRCSACCNGFRFARLDGRRLGSIFLGEHRASWVPCRSSGTA
uniref:Uncharacterized protein n=1 Tax=Zea mays TaxID=4577 RepID=A0A804PAN7_MAIZE